MPYRPKALNKKALVRALNPKALPRGSKYPNSRVPGPKIHTLNGFWTLEPYYLGTWTLRAKYKPKEAINMNEVLTWNLEKGRGRHPLRPFRAYLILE